MMPETIVTVEESGAGIYTQTISTAKHSLTADEPLRAGGKDLGPSPYEILLAALGACTSMTLRMYASRKEWDLKKVTVKLTHKKAADAENRATDIITRDITIEGDLDEEQRRRLLEIANKCPVHRTLTEEPRPKIISRLADS